MKEKLIPRQILLFCFLLATTILGRAQEQTVSGKVILETGEPLAGVSVTVQGTSTGTVSDSKGKYSLRVPSTNSILVFSYSGYLSQSVNVDGKSVINLTMETDSRQLSEVVVTALGIKKQRRSLGYSVQEVDGSSLVQARETNVINSLKGRVAGVHINSSASGPAGSAYIAIRGNSSLAGNNAPLIVVDGIPVNNDNLNQASAFGGRDFGDGIKDINPDDIESVSVLKGPNAASLYGSRGANGVILITTKKGTKRGLGVSFNSNATFETANAVPTFQNKWGMGYDDDFNTWGTVTVNGQQYKQQASWMLDNWGGKMDGQLIGIQTMPDLGLVPLIGQPEDNIMNFYRTGKTFTNTLSLSSSSEKINFRASLSNLDNKGIVPNNSFSRQTVNLIVGANITNKLYVEAKANYIRQTTDNRPTLGANRRNISQSISFTARHIDLAWLQTFKNPDGSYRSYNGNGGWPLNPYWIINEFVNNDRRDRVIGYAMVNYKFTDWLTLMLRSGTDFYADARFDRESKGSPGNWGGSVAIDQTHVNETNSDLLLTARGNVTKDFTGSISVGANHFSFRNETSGSWGNDLIVEGIYTVSNARNQFGIYNLIRKQINSVYGNGQLGYKNYLFLDIAARNDWSSTLSKGNYSFFYPSVSLSYILTDALNLNSRVINFAKLRASWAQAGSDASAYLTKAGYSINTNGFNGQPFSTISGNIPSADLKNELKSSWEVGTDVRFFNNRITADFTYYDATTKNQIMLVRVPSPTGFGNKLVNSGEVSNKGIELFVTGVPISFKNSLRWEIAVNFSKNKSKVVSLFPGVATQVLYGPPSSAIEARPGRPYGDIVGYKFKRTDDGQLLLSSGGMVQADNKTEVLGNIQPKWLAGITNTISFKRIVLSGLLDVRNGGNIYSFSMYRQMATGTGKFTENGENLVNNGVIEDGNGGYVKSTIVLPRQGYYAMQAWSGSSEPFVLSATYVAVREVTLGYDFNPKLLSKLKISTARLSVVGRNLLYLYRDPMFKTMGVSPETAFAPTAVAQGYEASSLPTTRSIGFNLSLGF